MGNVEVKAMKASYPEGRRILTPVQSVLTNDLGEYRLFWLTPGRYYVAAVHPKAQGMSQLLLALSVCPWADRPVWSSPAGRPTLRLANLESCRIWNRNPIRYAPVFYGGTTDEQTASGIDLREGADFGGVNFVVAPVQSRHVRGVVIDGVTGRPAQYGSITLPKDSTVPRMKDVEVDPETGTFDMLLFPGSHALTATSASGEGYATFTLGDADIENLTIPTTPAFDIQGRIVVDGAPVSAAALEALATHAATRSATRRTVDVLSTARLFRTDRSRSRFRRRLSNQHCAHPESDSAALCDAAVAGASKRLREVHPAGKRGRSEWNLASGQLAFSDAGSRHRNESRSARRPGCEKRPRTGSRTFL